MKYNQDQSNLSITAEPDSRDVFFQKIYREYGKRIRFYIQIRLPDNPDQCDDLTQHVLLKLYKNLHRYKPFYSLSTWVFSITQHVLIDYLRGMKRREEVITKEAVDIENKAGAYPDPLDEMITASA